MASDSWLAEHDACSRMGQDIMERITERNKENRTSSTYTKLSSTVRSSMKQFTSDLNRLRQNLIRASTSYLIQREVERRQVMIDNLTTKEKQLDQAFRNDGTESRYSLLGSRGTGDGSSDPWGIRDEPEDIRGMSNDILRQQQQHIIKEQDEGLEILSDIIGRQKQMGTDIGNEVDSQNILIDEIIDHTDNTSNRLIKETRHIRIVDRKSKTCWMYVVIILLLIAIIVIVAVPYTKKKT